MTAEGSLHYYQNISSALWAIVASAAFFLGLGFYISYGPIGGALVRLFASAKGSSTPAEAAKRQSVCRIVGAVHMAMQVPLALYVICDERMWADRLYSTTRESFFLLAISTGYFLADFIDSVVRLKEEGLAYLVHAVCCSVLFGYGSLRGVLHLYGAGFLLWELSTPFVYVRWFLHKLGRTKGRAYVVNGFAMMGTFFLARNVLGIAMSVDFFRATGVELAAPRPGGMSASAIWTYRIGNVVLNSLNAVWFSKMLRGAVRLLGKTSGPEPKNLHDD